MRGCSLKSSLIELPLGDNEEFFLSQQLIMQLTHVVIIEEDRGAKTDHPGIQPSRMRALLVRNLQGERSGGMFIARLHLGGWPISNERKGGCVDLVLTRDGERGPKS